MIAPLSPAALARQISPAAATRPEIPALRQPAEVTIGRGAAITNEWQTGPETAPVAVVMLTLNEQHHLDAALRNISGWAQEVFVVDSFSTDATVDIALAHGAHVVQRRFRGFGDQWNFALTLPIKAPWTMKLDPDERLTDALKASIVEAISANKADALIVRRRLWFIGRPLPIRQNILRVWRSGTCRFSDVSVNEHPLVDGVQMITMGDLDHHDSPTLHHWIEKQNRYTTLEASAAFLDSRLSAAPRLSGSALERRMWLKRNFNRFPLKYFFLFLYFLIVQGAWRAGTVGLIWARMRTQVYQTIEYKLNELKFLGSEHTIPQPTVGAPDPRVPQYD